MLARPKLPTPTTPSGKTTATIKGEPSNPQRGHQIESRTLYHLGRFDIEKEKKGEHNKADRFMPNFRDAPVHTPRTSWRPSLCEKPNRTFHSG